MAPRRNDAPTDASYVGDILDFTDEAVLVTLNHVRTLYLNMRTHQERKVKVAERDRVAMQALLPFIVSFAHFSLFSILIDLGNHSAI